MGVRLSVIAIAAMLPVGIARAQPAGVVPRGDVPRGDVPKSAPAPAAPTVILASASNDGHPSGDERAPQPLRRPAPRITTCRCGGDPQPAEDQPAETNPEE